MLRLSAIYRYALKSAQSERLVQARLEALGLEGDRRWMVVDRDSGRFLSQRLLPQMALIGAQYRGDQGLLLRAPGLAELAVALPAQDAPLRGVTVWRDSLQVPDAGEPAAAWLSGFLGRDCRLVHVPASRARQVDSAYAEAGDRVAFADGFPLLLLGQGSVDDLSARVGRPLEMLRFRPNLVIEGAPAYAEDGWRRIRIGALEFDVVKGCSRCIMTTLDPMTGERSVDREPLATLKGYRERDGAVYFGQNLIPRGTGVLEEGMAVQVLA